ncbi:unnamed protein product [Toxocara canis]|uniref:Uncharacterized protein n=1 Tax=Toxocara canis TaxID=6265 RepID=A0A183UC91_TOXCA|nr:unnamed protein product [Toxocara canis]
MEAVQHSCACTECITVELKYCRDAYNPTANSFNRRIGPLTCRHTPPQQLYTRIVMTYQPARRLLISHLRKSECGLLVYNAACTQPRNVKRKGRAQEASLISTPIPMPRTPATFPNRSQVVMQLLRFLNCF